jgi:hypothetical protein
MSGTVEDYDGLCGTIAPFGLHVQLRCKYDLNHEGSHSWEKYRRQFQIFGGITIEEVRLRAPWLVKEK